MDDVDVTYTFDQLSDKAKDFARDSARDWNVENHDWWESTYTDAKELGAKMGITIYDIKFSGFWSQGDGASFTGFYKYRQDAIAKIREDCTDLELIRIAEALTAFQVRMQFVHNSTVQCDILTRDRDVHHMSMSIDEFELSNNDDYDWTAQELDNDEKDILEILRDFAAWIYRQLQAEYEHLTSDEEVDQMLEDSYLFDDEGNII